MPEKSIYYNQILKDKKKLVCCGAMIAVFIKWNNFRRCREVVTCISVWCLFVGGPCGTVGHYGGQQLECVLEGLCQGQNRVSTYVKVKTV